MSKLFGSSARTKHSRAPATLPIGRALERMRTGSRLVVPSVQKRQSRLGSILPLSAEKTDCFRITIRLGAC
jgi:hypothetical protein